jgi:hypothetical protein
MARKKPETDVPDPKREALALFTEQFVDLDLFTQGVTVYEVTDVRGKVRSYEIPNDPPFPAVLAFQRAHDRYYQAMIEVARARGKTADALVAKVETAWSDLIGRPAERDEQGAQTRPERPGAFLELLRLRQPELSVAALLEEVGANFTQNWMETVSLRLQMARLAGGATSALEILGRAALAGGGEADPKANGRASSRSSAPSGAPKGGPTTTGGRSGGPSSGGRSRSS